ncbi:MAG: hypothetical protein A2W91_15285 [Bacteroidetes bacterium GWF2_38_335]|nr:MAG: hypothetical protein A2W91_15285 [Bacteroidetes bacterium GWF2_38_335]OFY81058.1 MAG: hypothetical protein A2281_13195 [Bacteroidetes bacterium RIFOXYA12_FULL_38_20]HBS87625.1 hypothetical protein [Bacteroidales bacterium]
MPPVKNYILLAFAFLSLFSFSQEEKTEKDTTKIEILNANSLEYSKKEGEFQKLKGNVIFKHDQALMYCDSAYFYKDKNALDAFGKVFIKQGDTLSLSGKFLKYDGETKMAKIRNKVRLADNEITLLTDSLDYDRNLNIGYYNYTARIVNNNNDLSSKIGYYYANDKLLFFKDSVVLINPKYTMYCDTLKYHTPSEIAYFFGPTEIFSDSGYIYCENGWYDTKKDISQFSQNAFLENKSQTLRGDSLYYDRGKGYGEAFRNVTLVDTTEKIILGGDYGIYFQSPEKSLFTGNAVFTHIMDKDSMYLHSDTLRMHTFSDTVKNMRIPLIIKDSLNFKPWKIDPVSKDTLLIKIDTVYLQIPDTVFVFSDTTALNDSIVRIPSDTIINFTPRTDYYQFVDSVMEFKLVRGHYRCKLFKSDFQGKCDSLVYSTRDSVMQLYHEPVLWSEKNQLTGKFIEMHTKNNELEKVYMREDAMIIVDEDSSRYNQIKGKYMLAFVKDREITRINVDGNSRALYFIKDDGENPDSTYDDQLLGVNNVECSQMIIYMKEGEVDKIHFKPASDGKVTPLNYEPAEKLRLPGFIWLDQHRPKKKPDIFIWSGFTKATELEKKAKKEDDGTIPVIEDLDKVPENLENPAEEILEIEEID